MKLTSEPKKSHKDPAKLIANYITKTQAFIKLKDNKENFAANTICIYFYLFFLSLCNAQ